MYFQTENPVLFGTLSCTSRNQKVPDAIRTACTPARYYNNKHKTVYPYLARLCNHPPPPKGWYLEYLYVAAPSMFARGGWFTLLLFLVVLYYTSGWGPDLFETCH